MTAEVLLYDAKVLLETLKHLAQKDEELSDYDHGLIPHLVEHEKVVEHRLNSYWRDVGTLESYFDTHMELLSGNGVKLDDPA